MGHDIVFPAPMLYHKIIFQVVIIKKRQLVKVPFLL